MTFSRAATAPVRGRVAHSDKPYELLYIEEPAVPGNIEVFKRLKAAISIPLAVDEALLAELAKKPSPPEWPTRGRLPDGSIADY